MGKNVVISNDGFRLWVARGQPSSRRTSGRIMKPGSAYRFEIFGVFLEKNRKTVQ